MVNCSSNKEQSTAEQETAKPINFFYGADLSYVNEMDDCGAVYKNRLGQEKDAYEIFKEEGANIIRLRLWHNPDWTNYSNLDDVKRSIRRAKEQQLRVLLDFHYSDTWADPSQQQIPEAWINDIDNLESLGSLLYDYTYDTLVALKNDNLLPDIVQIGNEINPMILQDGELTWPIDWSRNAYLLNKGISSVRHFNQEMNTSLEIMLHIAQPENALWWFDEATTNGVTGYDWIGLSYYPKWSQYTLSDVGFAFETLINTYNKKLMVVETAYPYTLNGWDDANNLLGEDALIPGYSPTVEGQLQYLKDLKTIIKNSGGKGLVYWEPAWVSTACSTLWGQGSHWENATMFDENNQAHNGISFFNDSFND